MKWFATIIQAVDWRTGEICRYQGPKIHAANADSAQYFCDTHGMGYCEVSHEWLMDALFVEHEMATSQRVVLWTDFLKPDSAADN